MVTLQDPMPVHAPDQPENVNPELGVAFSATTVPAASDVVQTFPQVMLPEALLTEPPCDAVTASAYVVAAGVPDSGADAVDGLVDEPAGSRHPASDAVTITGARI